MKRNINIFGFILTLLTLSMGVQAQTWEFASVSEEDQTLLNADATNWTYESSNNRWLNATTFTNSPLKANGTELDFAKGMLFTTEAADQIRIDNKKGSLTLNNKKAKITIPNVQAGQELTVVCQSSSSSTARTITATNVEGGDAFTASTARETLKGLVLADGNIEIQSTGGMYIYSISIGDADDEDGDTGGNDDPAPAADDHSTFASAASNQLVLTLANGKKYYNTADITSVDIADSKITINLGSTSDVFDGTINNISFKKATEGNNGTVDNAAGKVSITEARGWFETAYVKFTPYDGAKSYNVYIKGGNYADYTKIDAQLVRDYGTYGRADVLGLVKAENYAIKVVPVNESGSEIASAANEATGISVVNYDRSGFAHKDATEGIGAYNNDGSLKANANVVYVTKNNAKTVSLTIASSSNGKTTTYTGLQQIIYGYQKGDANGSYEKKPLDIRIIGTLSADDCDKFLSSAEGIQIKGARSYQKMNITIEGVGDDATTTGFGFLLRNSAYIELRNFANMLCMDDAVSIDTDNEHIWVHNLDLFYGNTGGDADQAKGDGTIDLKGNSRNITIAYNHLWDSGKASLCGMKSETGPNWITYHHNWFDHSDSRHPRIRTMSVHVYNNYFDGNSKYGVGAAYQSNAFVENNYFRNCKYPMLISKQGSDIATNSKGTFSGEDGGMIKSFGNKIIGATRYVTYQQNATEFDAYEATERNEQVPASVKAKQGGRGYDNFDTNAAQFYTYTPDAAEEVPGIVTGWLGAGRINHGDFQWTFDNATEDKNYDVIPELKAALKSYQSKLTGIFGGETISNGGGGNDGGSNGGGSNDPQDDPTNVDGDIVCTFDGNAPSSNFFTITGNYSNSKGTATYNGKTYTICLKLESATSIKFTTTKKMKLTLVFADGETGSIKIDGTKTTSTSNVLTADLEAGEHTLTKADTRNLFYISLTEIE
ncbi:MAG: pectate lyase [Prevotella sp.]|nr:pectate lyase [Prevotella sp.]